ncbi:MAG: alpha/beta hydrolase [Chloroflexi bacterium]|nr:alpha/beta hydrolase [Chloroflexota bacterium]
MLREGCFFTGELQINFAEGQDHGQAFVLLHAGAARWQYGLALIEALTLRWHVYAPDFRGHGSSGRVRGARGRADLGYQLQNYVDDTAAFIERAVGEAAIVYGHSLGGEVGVMLAAQHPELVSALIVGDAPLSTDRHATEEPAHRAQNELWYALAGQPAEEIETALRAMLVPVPGTAQLRPATEVLGEDSEWFALQAATLQQLDPGVLGAVLAGPEVMLSGYEPRVLLPAIECPTLLLQADPHGPLAGGVLRDEEVRLGLALLRHGQHVRLDGIGHPLHGPAWQMPRVLAAIEGFLADRQ